MSTRVQYRRNTHNKRAKKKEFRERKSTKKAVDDSSGAHCITSTIVENCFPFVLSDRVGKCALRREENEERKSKIFITKVRVMMAILMVNYVVYDDDVSYFFDVVGMDHHSMLTKNLNVMVMRKLVIVIVIEIDFDYCLVEIVFDDDDDFCDDDGGDVCETSFSFSSSYVSSLMTVK